MNDECFLVIKIGEIGKKRIFKFRLLIKKEVRGVNEIMNNRIEEMFVFLIFFFNGIVR